MAWRLSRLAATRLVAGAAATVLVAWAMALAWPWPDLKDGPMEWAASRRMGVATTDGSYSELMQMPTHSNAVLDTGVVGVMRYDGAPVPDGAPPRQLDGRQVFFMRAGWPWRVMGSRWWLLRSGETGVTGPWPELWKPVRAWGERVVPVEPIWPTFAWSAAAWGLVLMVRPTWREVRVWGWARAGRCTGCGYEIRGLTTCPECGRARAG